MKTSISLLVFICASSLAKNVFWLPNKSINLAVNYQDGKLPCPGQTVVFPESVDEGILVSSLSVSGLILPNDGEIILEEGGILLGPDGNNNCTRVGETYYKIDLVSSWAQPDAWSSAEYNKATPDAEKVPCYDDNVYIPSKGQFAVKLPELPQTVKMIMEKDTGIILSLVDLVSGQNDRAQQFIKTNGDMLTVTHDNPLSARPCSLTLQGCPCQNYALDIECKLKYCLPARCSHPIKPVGHCCELCGASLLIDVTDKFNMEFFRDLVKTTLQGYGLDKFDYHIGLLPKKYAITQTSPRVQLIVLDRGEYTGLCQQVIYDVNYALSGEWVKENHLFLSGNPSSKSSEGGKIFVIAFVLVAIVMGGMFGYYYKWSVSNLNELRGDMTRGMLSRLQRRTESVMSLTRRDSTVSTATTGGIAFRNPIYSSLRERAQVVEAVNEAVSEE